MDKKLRRWRGLTKMLSHRQWWRWSGGSLTNFWWWCEVFEWLHLVLVGGSFIDQQKLHLGHCARGVSSMVYQSLEMLKLCNFGSLSLDLHEHIRDNEDLDWKEKLIFIVELAKIAKFLSFQMQKKQTSIYKHGTARKIWPIY